jgi:hypothetical protein
MAIYNPTADEREKALGDVYYELQQLVAASVIGTDHPNVENALIESRLLHVRTLVDFFEAAPSSDDDVLASHYGFPQTSLPIDSVYRQRLNKDLAHLTYSRTKRTARDKVWPYERVVLPVLERGSAFIEHVVSSQQSTGPHDRPAWVELRNAVTSVIAALSKRP